jgi:hypothetical protein
MTAIAIRPKDPGETLTVAFSFRKVARAVSAPTVTAVEFTAVDSAPSGFLLGDPFLDPASPTRVFQRVHGGLDAGLYGLKCLATNEKGDVVACAGIIRVAVLPENT